VTDPMPTYTSFPLKAVESKLNCLGHSQGSVISFRVVDVDFFDPVRVAGVRASGRGVILHGANPTFDAVGAEGLRQLGRLHELVPFSPAAPPLPPAALVPACAAAWGGCAGSVTAAAIAIARRPTRTEMGSCACNLTLTRMAESQKVRSEN